MFKAIKEYIDQTTSFARRYKHQMNVGDKVAYVALNVMFPVFANIGGGIWMLAEWIGKLEENLRDKIRTK